MIIDWREIYGGVMRMSAADEKKPLYEDGRMRVCKCGRDYDGREAISACQKDCKHWEAWDAYCYHYRWGDRNDTELHLCDFRGD